MAIIKHMTNHASYDEIMDRLDNALIKNESLQDEIKILKHNELVNKSNKNLDIERTFTKNKKFVKKIKGLNELVEEQAEEIKTLKEDKKELVKDVELLNDEIKILNNMIYRLIQDQTEEIKALKNINLGSKGGE